LIAVVRLEPESSTTLAAAMRERNALGVCIGSFNNVDGSRLAGKKQLADHFFERQSNELYPRLRGSVQKFQ
jgi:hypothetical protein